MDFSGFTTISFDCYGTLIDWESGILPVLRTLLGNHGQSLPDAALLELYGEFEAEAESGPYQSSANPFARGRLSRIRCVRYASFRSATSWR